MTKRGQKGFEGLEGSKRIKGVVMLETEGIIFLRFLVKCLFAFWWQLL